MESSTHRAETERQRQLEIRRQIKALQAQLTDLPGGNVLVSPERKRTGSVLLAPSTPSPRKKRRLGNLNQGRKLPTTGSARNPRESNGQVNANGHTSEPPPVIAQQLQPPPSSVLQKLSSFRKQPGKQSLAPSYVRSSSLSEKPQPCPTVTVTRQPDHEAAHESSHSVPERDDNLAIVEELRMGPIDHKAPPDDPLFEHFEPNSGIRLSTRSLSHEDLQEYLRGRYYLSPSRLYSCIRLLPNKSGYDVPVEGDWVTIAVVAERGPVRVSRAPVSVEPGDDGRTSDNETSPSMEPREKSTKKQTHPPKSHGKKYVNMKLIDFGACSKSSATGGKAVLRGDAFLSLLLFESDSFDKVKQDDGTERKIYQGGSRGAFEAMSKLKEGDVVTILNPKILKPYQRSEDSPHPTNNILAVTPESAGSIAIIGRARDLGMCKVTKRDGTICGSWTDKRVSEVCEWHLTNAVQRQRAGRAEFFAGTSGMSDSTVRKRKGDFDPSRQWGLKPETTPNDSTYVVSGHVVGGAAGSLFISERLGREAQAKAKRKLERNTDRELKSLLDRDKEGMKAVTKAREYAAHMAKSSKAASSGKVDKGKQKARDPLSTEDEVNTSLADVSSSSVKQAYSASIIKQLGFDPAAKGGKRADDPCLQKKIEALAAVQSSRKNIDLGPRPGPKIRSGVSVPAFMEGKAGDIDGWRNALGNDDVHSGDEALVDLDSDF
ncbi:hypothetical protein EDD16DRAFT_1554654 [Pisolithus croceorrhizus]|nr:hypothetical protein EDD16DRAFT_1554654 [Pisolithus croceorrhizus]KAI6167701.1 hypothetical protein EDD17DRAFT_1685815 [Pisolithus thermaeus]